MTDNKPDWFNKTLGPISNADLQKAHKVMEAEKAKIQERDDSLAPPAIKSEPESDPPSERTRASLVDINRTGEIADKFMSGLDKISDVLLILVLKFGRATSLLLGVLMILGVAICFLIWNVIMIYNTRMDMAELMDQVQEVQKKQGDTIVRAEAAEKRAEAAEEKAAEAAEAAPKIVVDEAGRARLIVKEDLAQDTPSPSPRPTSKASKRPTRTEQGVAFPIDF